MTASTDRPNILFILVDDMGYSDIGCFGSEIPTPYLDDLALQGIRQTQMYNTARCCPTRASLMTGLHPHRAGIGAMTKDLGTPAYQGWIHKDKATVAERMREAGYATWMSGKWHCGGDYAVHQPDQWERDAGDEKHPLPTQRGFDRFYGTLAGAGSFFDPPTLMDQDRFVPCTELPEDYYLTDELGKRAATFIEETPEDKPFFGYLAFTAPHWPLHAFEKDIAPHRGKYKDGWDALRVARLKKQVELGLVPEDQALSDRDEKSKPWDEAEHKEWEQERMAVYAAQVATMDRAVGYAVEALKKSGRFENTLIVFLSDNGGCAEYLREDGEPGRWPEFYSLPTKKGTQTKTGNTPSKMPGPAETFMSYDLPWANASNTPFRKFKAWTHEGGISTAMIACWPKGLPQGEIRHHASYLVDLVATACELGGANGDELDGVDLMPLWREDQDVEPTRDRPLCWEHYGHCAVRRGKWKLVKARFDDPWELYDIDTDRIEQNDLSSAMPELVKELDAQWSEWAQWVGVKDFGKR